MLKTQEILCAVFISALIGTGVGSLFQYINGGTVISGIATGAVSGAVIGLLSQYSFMLIYLTLSKHPLLALLSVIVTIGLGTSGFCLLWKVAFPIPGLPIVAVSETAGIIATGLSFYNYQRLNRKLKEKKQALSKTQD